MTPADEQPVTGFQVLTAAGRDLVAAGIESGQGDAMQLMAHAFGAETPRYALMGVLRDPLPEDVADRFAQAVTARLKRQPVSQISGGRHFWKHRFKVTPDTLDPRPDTETLVATALEVPFTSVLDLGTGTGCIVISLLAERPVARGTAVDLSVAALDVARDNARMAEVSDRLMLVNSDWFAAVEGGYDLIVSNPPYIAASEMAGLEPEVRDWEPRMALTDEDDGLTAYRAITGGATSHLVPGGHLMVEIGLTQGPSVSELFREAGLENVRVIQDLDGRDRVVAGRRALR